MKYPLVLVALPLLGLVSLARAQDPPQPLATGLKHPTAAAVGFGGKVYVATAGTPGRDGDGEILLVGEGKTTPFARGLDDPSGLVAHQQNLLVLDKSRVWRVNAAGKATVFVAATAFPNPPPTLRALAVDGEGGLLYVSTTAGVVYRVDPQGRVSAVAEPGRGDKAADGLLLDAATHLLIADSKTGELRRLRLPDGSTEKVADGVGGPMTRDYHGRLFTGNAQGTGLLVIPRPGDKPVALARGFRSAGVPCLGPTGKQILVPDAAAGTLTAVPITVPGAEVDESPLPLRAEIAFPDLHWAGWKPETDAGIPVPLRPIVLTHAGDGSNRVFVATQHGVIHSFAHGPKATKTTVFLDLQDRVKYNDKTNEEGFLGLAFHPQYKTRGEIFVFYTPKKGNLTNVVSRFRVRKDDPTRADPDSEEELLRFTKPFWNHDGGTIGFGPDGHLYVTHGDGGAANDPHDNGQNLKSLLGKVLRIDVNRKDPGKNYAIPPDNPFVGRTDALPEIWAYGLRNVWRMAFDRQTGQLWAGDVGQNLWEEVNLITRGGNYGWNRREGLHPFGAKGTGPRPDYVEPIWEYHHDVGKSITGGVVYRGPRLPELAGSYLYADYVSGRVWALRYDEARKRVTANRPFPDLSKPILSFGEDEQGEAYYLVVSPSGRDGIYHFVPK